MSRRKIDFSKTNPEDLRLQPLNLLWGGPLLVDIRARQRQLQLQKTTKAAKRAAPAPVPDPAPPPTPGKSPESPEVPAEDPPKKAKEAKPTKTKKKHHHHTYHNEHRSPSGNHHRHQNHNLSSDTDLLFSGDDDEDGDHNEIDNVLFRSLKSHHHRSHQKDCHSGGDSRRMKKHIETSRCPACRQKVYLSYDASEAEDETAGTTEKIECNPSEKKDWKSCKKRCRRKEKEEKVKENGKEEVKEKTRQEPAEETKEEPKNETSKDEDGKRNAFAPVSSVYTPCFYHGSPAAPPPPPSGGAPYLTYLPYPYGGYPQPYPYGYMPPPLPGSGLPVAPSHFIPQSYRLPHFLPSLGGYPYKSEIIDRHDHGTNTIVGGHSQAPAVGDNDRKKKKDSNNSNTADSWHDFSVDINGDNSNNTGGGGGQSVDVLPGDWGTCWDSGNTNTNNNGNNTASVGNGEAGKGWAGVWPTEDNPTSKDQPDGASTAPPPSRRNWTPDDLDVLGRLHTCQNMDRWRDLQAAFYNETGRVVDLELLKSKIEERDRQ